MDQAREAVITGAGVISPIGIGKDAFWESLCTGQSGVRSIPQFEGFGLPVPFAAKLRDFDSKQYVKPRKSLKVMAWEIQIGFSAAAMAIQDAGLDPPTLDPDRFGVVFGSEMLYGEIEELEEVYRRCCEGGTFQFSRWGPTAMSKIYPLWMLKYLPNMTACHIGIAHDARGPNNTIALGEVSSLLALMESARVIMRGDADVVISGGAGSRLNITPMLYRGDQNLSHRCDDPAAASRPFDAGRDGMVNGEGGAAFVLEERSHAEARGAAILARIAGFGSSFEDRLGGRPLDGHGIRNSIQAALRSAGMEPGQIGHVNAHGISTIEDDIVEARAIRQCLGDLPVTAPKSYFGNLGAGGGAVEMVASLMAINFGRVPATLNYEVPDPACPINVVSAQPLTSDVPTALLLNQSGTGQAAAIIIAAPGC